MRVVKLLPEKWKAPVDVPDVWTSGVWTQRDFTTTGGKNRQENGRWMWKPDRCSTRGHLIHRDLPSSSATMVVALHQQRHKTKDNGPGSIKREIEQVQLVAIRYHLSFQVNKRTRSTAARLPTARRPDDAHATICEADWITSGPGMGQQE